MPTRPVLPSSPLPGTAEDRIEGWDPPSNDLIHGNTHGIRDDPLRVAMNQIVVGRRGAPGGTPRGGAQWGESVPGRRGSGDQDA